MWALFVDLPLRPFVPSLWVDSSTEQPSMDTLAVWPPSLSKGVISVPTTRLSCHVCAQEAEAKFLCFKCAPTQVSLGDSCLEADHVISALPAPGSHLPSPPRVMQAVVSGPVGPYHVPIAHPGEG